MQNVQLRSKGADAASSEQKWLSPVIFALIGLLGSSFCSAQSTVVLEEPVKDGDLAATRTQVTSLRDAFVKATLTAGFKCSITPPTIIVQDVPSFGMYDAETNTLTTPAWRQILEPERKIFYRLAGPNADDEAARKEFETGVHHWVFVHELGHWWQACRRVPDDGKHYAKEFGANRIAAAYWREQDPTLIAHMRAAFEGILAHTPNPVPKGQNLRVFFDANYDELGPTPAYIWFQSQMVVKAFDEKPAPTFAGVLKQTKP